ncbi:hypothetical protein L7F22_060583 [Adiantum nelumboides]|nr:hypothetical protein [Adiantum nelumboides]
MHSLQMPFLQRQVPATPFHDIRPAFPVGLHGSSPFSSQRKRFSPALRVVSEACGDMGFGYSSSGAATLDSLSGAKINSHATAKWRRVLLKVSGEALSGDGRQNIDPKITMSIASEIAAITKLGIQVAVVVGGGNFFRGSAWAGASGLDRATADYIGLVRVKSPLKQLVTSEEWDAWTKGNEAALHIEHQILSAEFWVDIEKYVKVLWPVMAMLCMVDRDVPCMGVVYEGIDMMLEQIKEEEVDDVSMYEEISLLAQERWEMLHSPLHATAFVLNPQLFSKKPHKYKDVMKGWRMTLDRVGKSTVEKTEFKAELS